MYLIIVLVKIEILRSALLNFQLKIRQNNSLLQNITLNEKVDKNPQFDIKYSPIICKDNPACTQYNCKIEQKIKDKNITLIKGTFKDRSFPFQTEKNFWICDNQEDASNTNLKCKDGHYHKYDYKYTVVSEERNVEICRGKVNKQIKVIELDENRMEGFSCKVEQKGIGVNGLDCVNNYYNKYKMVSYDYMRYRLHEIKVKYQFKFGIVGQTKWTSNCNELNIQYSVGVQEGAQSQQLQKGYEDWIVNDKDQEYVKMRNLVASNYTKSMETTFRNNFKAYLNIYKLQRKA